LNILYQESGFDYSNELPGLRRSYLSLIERALAPEALRGSILEVGGGNGFFLEGALEMGFTEAQLIEPSRDAVSKARDDIQRNAVTDTLEPGLVASESKDVVVLFHVVDHLPDPFKSLETCLLTLKSGGSIVLAAHDVKSLSARLLGKWSPIFDVEHTYLFSQETAAKLLREVGFVNVKTGRYKNHYSLAYLTQLVPLPRKLKVWILSTWLGVILRSIKVTVGLGNLWASGQKPDS
jgi:2-polyprenyl-3-methyl-5-hydroxy-6-metoxy-1,4-benzoquinol methylase